MKCRISGLIIFLVFTLAISGCAGGPKAYRELDSAPALQANHENPAALVYKKTDADPKKYKKFIIDPIGSFMGSVTLVGEFYDGETNTLVYAFLVKKTPDAMDMLTVFTGIDAPKKAITETAVKFR